MGKKRFHRVRKLQNHPDYVNYAERLLEGTRSFVQNAPLPIQRKRLLRLPMRAGSRPKPLRSWRGSPQNKEATEQRNVTGMRLSRQIGSIRPPIQSKFTQG